MITLDKTASRRKIRTTLLVKIISFRFKIRKRKIKETMIKFEKYNKNALLLLGKNDVKKYKAKIAFKKNLLSIMNIDFFNIT
jgi:hypothetical protein